MGFVQRTCAGASGSVNNGDRVNGCGAAFAAEILLAELARIGSTAGAGDAFNVGGERVCSFTLF